MPRGEPHPVFITVAWWQPDGVRGAFYAVTADGTVWMFNYWDRVWQIFGGEPNA